VSPRGGPGVSLSTRGCRAGLQDYEDRIHLAVTLEDDPGRDLGRARQPGHLFFFSPDEVEPLMEDGQ
jgi:hypothetical protein